MSDKLARAQHTRVAEPALEQPAEAPRRPQRTHVRAADPGSTSEIRVGGRHAGLDRTVIAAAVAQQVVPKPQPRLDPTSAKAVSYTHLDVYKRQPIGHARSYSGTMGASGATGSASGRGRDWGFGSLGAGACEGASTTTLSISSTGVFGAAGSSTASEPPASFSAANENGTGHNNPNTNSAQSAKAALILSAAFHGGILYAVGFVINRNHFYCSRVSSTLAQ